MIWKILWVIRMDKQWFYTDKVKRHFFTPSNIAKDQGQIDEIDPNGLGEVGNPTCGDVMKMWIRVEDDRIKACRWQTFGCASAIATTSVLSEMITKGEGMRLDDAMLIKPKDIISQLDNLPKNKIHCSVLGDQALRAAIEDYKKKVMK